MPASFEPGPNHDPAPLAPADVIPLMEPGATLGKAEVLTGGRSGASVYHVFVRKGMPRPGFQTIAGHHILKIARQHPGFDEKSAYDRCRELAPAFMAQYSPILHANTYKDRNFAYLLFTLANSEDTANTISPSIKDERLPEIVQEISHQLLGGQSHNEMTAFNSGWTDHADISCEVVLRDWLGNRADLGHRRSEPLRRVAERSPRLQGAKLHFAERLFPDPLCIISEKEVLSHKRTRLRGLLHGDLHLENVLCKESSERKVTNSRWWIIDFARATESWLLFDHAYLYLWILCEAEPALSDASLLALLEGKRGTIRVDRAAELKGSLQAISKAIDDWGHRVSGYLTDIPGQWYLALFAAGISRANKRRIEPYQADRAYLVSAFAAKQYLDHYGINWGAATGPTSLTLGLGKQHQAITTSSNTDQCTAAPSEGSSVSGLLIVNALLKTAEFTWERLTSSLGLELLNKLRNGLQLTEDEMRVLENLAAETGLFENRANVQAFMACEGSDRDIVGLEHREQLVGTDDDFPANRALRKLLSDKKRFAAGEWLKGVKEGLKAVAEWPVGGAPSARSAILNKAYYHAGIRLTAEQMRDAAIADFGHSRWQTYINSDVQRGYPHLLAANEWVGSHLAEQVLPGKHAGRPIRIVEGGVGGGHTTYFVLRKLSEESAEAQIEYFGMELVPALSEEMNSRRFGFQNDGSEREHLFRTLRNLGKLNPLASNGRMVHSGPMEESICDLWYELAQRPKAEASIDAFITSFSFHHVPNGQAIIQFLSNDAHGFEETLDRDTAKDAIVSDLIKGSQDLYEAYNREDVTRTSFEAERERVLQSISDDYSPAKVFLSLFDPGAVTETALQHFCNTLKERFWYPRALLQRMIRNPQREVLLTAQSLLRQGGVLVIADPDGTSDFNAKNALTDHELTIANFLTSDELCALLDELGFEAIEAYRILKKENKNEFEVKRQARYDPWETPEITRRSDYGYVVVARRDQSREREISAHNRRHFSPQELSLEDEAGRESPVVASLGKLLRESGPGVSTLIKSIFSRPDPLPHSGYLFRDHLALKHKLSHLRWLRTLPGTAVVANRRIHRFESKRKLIHIATDFPETPQEIRQGVPRVFSHSDEAETFISRLSKIDLPRRPRILDLCSGAGTLGVLSATLHPEAKVVCLDKEPRAIAFVKVNQVLNGIEHERIEAVQQEVAEFQPSVPFDLILADPPFSLRPEGEHPGRSDDGGEYGDKVSAQILEKAPFLLAPRGRMIMLAYSLFMEDGTLRLKENPLLDGRLQPADGHVWRFRNDKLAPNIGAFQGIQLRYLAIRLADPTRPECMTYHDAADQRRQFKVWAEWLEGLQQSGWVGLRFLRGEFTRRSGA